MDVDPIGPDVYAFQQSGKQGTLPYCGQLGPAPFDFLGSPGVIYARRYRVLEGTSGYSTVYEFASTAVPESREWKEQQQHSSPNSPRTRQAMTHAPGSAGVYVRVNP
jgi:hypothetical protein